MIEPIVNVLSPHSRTNPAGQTKRIKSASRAVNRRLRVIEANLKTVWRDLPVIVHNQRRYEYQVDANLLQFILDALNQALEDVNQQDVVDAAVAAYRQGTAQAVENLRNLTDAYPGTIETVLQSTALQRRTALVRTRVFEEMKGFSGETGRDLSRILSQAIQDGKNPETVVKDIAERFRISRGRALRISRTEITGALRRANWDESEAAERTFGIRQGLMHFSALSPTTRQTHADRHGRVFSIPETREWYTINGNSINCRCTQRSVELDENGDPIIGRKLQKRLAVQREEFVAMV